MKQRRLNLIDDIATLLHQVTVHGSGSFAAADADQWRREAEQAETLLKQLFKSI